MRIGLVEAVGAELDPIEFSWTSGDVQLYHLGFGPGADPMNPRELCYLIDDIPQVLPTFWERHGGELPRNRGAGGEVSGNLYRAERGAASHRRGHRAGAATGHRLGAVGHPVVWDKGKAAVIVIETSVTDVDRRGDCNPLHSDPAFAAAAVFLRPILHGLCTYDIRCKAIVDAFLRERREPCSLLRRPLCRRGVPG